MLRTVPIQLDKERRLKYDLNAFAVLKERHGINLFQPDAERLADPIAVRAMLWVGLIHEDPTLTVDQVGGWVDLGNFAEVSEKVADAMLTARARDVPGESERPFPVAPTSTGASSTS